MQLRTLLVIVMLLVTLTAEHSFFPRPVKGTASLWNLVSQGFEEKKNLWEFFTSLNWAIFWVLAKHIYRPSENVCVFLLCPDVLWSLQGVVVPPWLSRAVGVGYRKTQPSSGFKAVSVSFYSITVALRESQGLTHYSFYSYTGTLQICTRPGHHSLTIKLWVIK